MPRTRHPAAPTRIVKYKLLARTHAEVDLALLRRHQDLFEGGASFRARVADYLPRNDVEPAAVHKKRCERAHYLNYCASITNFFASALFTSPPVLASDPAEVDAFYADLREDADGTGTDLDALLRDMVVRALVGRRAYLRVEFPPVAGAAPTTLADADAAGLRRARLVPVPTEAIRHWRRAPDGTFAWVVEYDRREELLDFSDEAPTVTETWTQWFADGGARRWQLVRRAEDRPRPEDTVPEIEPLVSPCGAIPLVELRLPPELWLLNHLADPALEHFRKRNALSWAIDRTCYAMPFFFLKDARKPPTMGAGYYGILGMDEKVDWPSPPSTPFDVIAANTRELVQELHRVAQQMALGVDNNASAIGRSGDSKKADHEATEIVLKAYGKRMREPLERVMDLISRGRGERIVWSVGGMDVYDLADAATLTDMAVASDPLRIPSATYRRELFKAVTRAQLPNLGEDARRAIDAEIDAGVSAEELLPGQAPGAPPGNAPDPTAEAPAAGT